MNRQKIYIIAVFSVYIFATQSYAANYAANNLKSDPSVNGVGCESLYVHIEKKF